MTQKRNSINKIQRNEYNSMFQESLQNKKQFVEYKSENNNKSNKKNEILPSVKMS